MELKDESPTQSDVPIDLLDVDKNSAVVSFSECDSEVSCFSSQDKHTVCCCSRGLTLLLCFFSSLMGTSFWPLIDVRLTLPDSN